MLTMHIRIERTPNPHALKFLVNYATNLNTPTYFTNIEQATDSSLARKLLSTPDVIAVFFGSDFITITKNNQGIWKLLKPEVIVIITDHFDSGLSTFDTIDAVEENIIPNISATETQIVDIINTKIRPAVAMDGGDIIYKSFNEGVVELEFHGACAGCPMADVTLKDGVESTLKHYIPEIKSVKATNS